jgi:SAM-dependent methyltransferase
MASGDTERARDGSEHDLSSAESTGSIARELPPLDTGESPLDFARAPDLALLKRVMAQHGYSREALLKTGGLPVRGLDLDIAEMLRRTSVPSPFNTLARLFLLAREVPSQAAAAALAPITVEAMLGFGLLRGGSRAGLVRGLCALVPFGDMLMLRDFEPHISRTHLRSDHVLGVGFATMLLANLTVRRAGQRVLDIGTGQGFHALLASEHAREVVATDVNPRALAFARAASLLNSCGDRVSWRMGSLFEPVAGDAPFDLIVSNPPFVIAPPHDTVAIGGRHEGDDLCREMITEASRHLAPGGYASILFNWHHRTDEDWRERPGAWLDAAGIGDGRGAGGREIGGEDPIVDAWIVRFMTEPGVQYARRWLIESGSMPRTDMTLGAHADDAHGGVREGDLDQPGDQPGDQHGEQHGEQHGDQHGDHVADAAGVDPASPLGQWLAYYARLGAERISMGVCVLHRRGSATAANASGLADGGFGHASRAGAWRRFETLPMQTLDTSAGPQIRRIMLSETLRALAREAGARDGAGDRAAATLSGPDHAILDTPLRMCRDIELDQRLVLTPEGTWGIRRATLTHTLGFGMPLGIDGVVMQFVTLCDGSRTPRDIAMELVQRLGGSLAQALEQTARLADRLLALGYVEPPGME